MNLQSSDFDLQMACATNKPNIVKSLLKNDQINPSCNNNFCIQIACASNYIEVAELLIQDDRTDISASGSFCIRAAIKAGNRRIIELLLRKLLCNKFTNHCAEDLELIIMLQRTYLTALIMNVVMIGFSRKVLRQNVRSLSSMRNLRSFINSF